MVVLMRTYLAAKAASINVIPKHDVLVIVGGTPHIKHLEEIIVPAYAAVIVTRKAFAINFGGLATRCTPFCNAPYLSVPQNLTIFSKNMLPTNW